MSNQLRNVLVRMSYYHSPVNEKRIIEEVLRDCKRERKELSKEQIEAKGYDIFENRNVRAKDIIESAISKSYIIATAFEPNNRMLLLSDIGRAYLFSLNTNNNSKEFQAFKIKVDQIMSANQELPLNTDHIAMAFWGEEDPEEFCSYYLKRSSYQNQTEKYHQYLLSSFGHQPTDKDYIFHLVPKLFVPRDKMGEDVSLKIEGVGEPKSLFISQPYPNKRYYVAGVKKKEFVTASGFYPIIADRDHFPKELDLKLIWTMENFKVEHLLHISFEFAEHPGTLFSTEQFISRSNNIKEKDVRTYAEKSEELWGERTPKFSTKNVFRELVIEESVTLTNIPIYMHSAFHADKHFQKWMHGA